MGIIVDRSIALLFVVIGILEIALGIPLFLGKVKPNRIYGFRIAYTWTDERIWYPVNRVAGIEAMVHGGVLAVWSVILAFLVDRLNTNFVVMLQLFLLLAPIVAMAVHLTGYASRLHH